MVKYLTLKLIRLYQHTLSPDHGPARHVIKGGFCRYHPTCSQYTYESVEKFGVVLGTFSGIWRIWRCNPFSKGGLDEPNKQKIKKQAFFGALSITIFLVILYLLALLLRNLTL